MGDPLAITAQHVFAAAVLLKRADALSVEIDGVRAAADIECVHRMRVASRRLRNAMKLFEPYLPALRLKKWKKGITRVTRALGPARDLDVQIEFLDRFINGLAQSDKRRYEPGIARLLLRLRQQRQRVQPGVISAMDRLEKTGLVGNIQQTMRRIQVEGRASHGVNADAPHRLEHQAAQVILNDLEQMLVFERYLKQPQHIEELHQMRIAAKHLRYTLEAYASLYENKLKPQIKMMRTIQTLLGDIHDCDVWIESLPRFLDREKARFEAFFGHSRGFGRVKRGIDYLLANRRAARATLHQDLIELWDRLTTAGSWQQLRHQIQEDDRRVEVVVNLDKNPFTDTGAKESNFSNR